MQSQSNVKISRISVVIPVLNDARNLDRLLRELRVYGLDDVTVVDGRSTDDPKQCIRFERFVECDPNRGCQIALGIEQTTGDWIWILHADTRISEAAVHELKTMMTDASWGRFDVVFDSRKTIFKVISWAMNVRSALTGICTGDQGIFIARHLLDKVSELPNQPLMEDLAISKQLRKLARPKRIRSPLVASPRKWNSEGIYRTIWKMTWLRFLYFCGRDPIKLATRYYSDAQS